MIIREYALNKMDATGNGGAKNDKTAMPCHREMAGLLDFAHKVWYATVGILAQTHRAYFGLCRNNNYVSNRVPQRAPAPAGHCQLEREDAAVGW